MKRKRLKSLPVRKKPIQDHVTVWESDGAIRVFVKDIHGNQVFFRLSPQTALVLGVRLIQVVG